jgi:hypothetical protein
MEDHTRSLFSVRHHSAPVWMSYMLVVAAVYNAVWGGFVVLFPDLLFEWTGMELPRYPELWQCIGMVVGVYSVGYLTAARDPYRHWPIVLVGLLGKVAGPIGFVKAIYTGSLPLAFGSTILTNDLIWWIPFGLVLKGAYDHHRESEPNV